MSDPRFSQPPMPGRYPQGAFYPPPKQRKTWPLVLGGFLMVVLLFFGGCAALFGSAAHEIAKGVNNRTTTAGAGSEVRDGKFSFVVTQVDPPVDVVGTDEFMRKEAQGEYVLVHVTVTNISNVAQTYFGENQKLIDDQAHIYSNDTMAELNLNKDIATQINPGNKLSVTIAFDVPKGTVPTAIEFHDSMFSGGARVALK
ncbi:DUF4352 domain-containing protein [Nocardia sp. CDC160]|uniref:DUF4352 domain-containing protein n=1 Tax=Nocardia sp. CDC160 TaxID=3112166 RepID=UPI002DB84973|nr:DUF4352 domain-containing protein [Nocardia sp. CDC160]MEC3920189.1 DUF4352 domain-containing protein [Nocardia sp. CDC160]